MNTIYTYFIIFICAITPLSVRGTSGDTLYVSTGCINCANVEEYFEKEEKEIPILDVKKNRSAAIDYREHVDACGDDINNSIVPMLTVMSGSLRECIYGDTDIISYFETGIIPYRDNTTPEPCGVGEETTGCTPEFAPSQAITIGAVISAALIDAINPCAFAVLILLLASIIKRDNKRRIIQSGFAFAGAIFLSYFAMGLGLYQALATASLSQLFMQIVGIIAICLGARNIKDGIWYKQGPNLEVPKAWRPRMKRIIKNASHPIGAFGVGILVSLFLLPCTSGPYIVIISMLQDSQTFGQALRLLVLYNGIFILPMIAITIAIYFGSNIHALEEFRKQNIKTLHLIAGIVLILLGVIVIFYT